MSPKRKNPFSKIYAICNKGNPKEKFANLKNFPSIIDVELTNSCNFSCLMCPTGNKTIGRKQGFMDMNIYEKFIKEASVHKTPLRFIGWGEPTLHKNWKECFKMAKDADLLVHFNTNGSLLNEKSIQDVIDMQIDSVKFSFQGADRKSYQEMRNTDFFEGLKEKIKTFYKMRGETLFPYIQVSTTTTYESEEMIEKFKKDFSSYTDYLNVGATNLDHIDIDEHDDGSEYWSRLRKLKEQSQKGLKKYVDCPEVYDKLTLRWDGTISACCGDFDNVMKLGNIKEKSLSEIWHSNKANNYRKILSEGGHAKLPLCKNCVQYIPLEK